MTYLGQTKIAINNVKTLKLFTVTKLKIRHFSHFYDKCTANSDGRGLFGQKGDQIVQNLAKNSPYREKSPLKGTQFSTLTLILMQYLLRVDINYGVLDQEYSVLADVFVMGQAQALLSTLKNFYIFKVQSQAL